jgi:type II secretory pathway component PulF
MPPQRSTALLLSQIALGAVIVLIVAHSLLVFRVPSLVAMWDEQGLPLAAWQRLLESLSYAAKNYGFVIYLTLALLLGFCIWWRVTTHCHAAKVAPDAKQA